MLLTGASSIMILLPGEQNVSVSTGSSLAKSLNHLKFWPIGPAVRPGPVFCLLLGVSSGYAQPITGQVTEVTCPVIGRAQPELTPNKRQKTWAKLRLCSANHRPGYWSNMPCDWPSTARAYSEQETDNRPWPAARWDVWIHIFHGSVGLPI